MFFYNSLVDIVTEIAALSGTYAVNAGDIFGLSVSINGEGNIAIVGARQDELPTSASGSGLAYVFRNTNEIWTLEQILSGTYNISANDFFGSSVSINKIGDTIAIGSDNDEVSPKPNGSGIVYIFKSSSLNGWYEQAALTGSQTAVTSGSTDGIGWSVKLNYSGDILFASAPYDEAPGNTGQTGLLYVFRSGSSGWYEENYLSGVYATNANDSIGWSGILSFKETLGTNEFGTKCVIGAPSDEIPTNASSSGVAYVFKSGSVGWESDGVLSGAYATGSNDYFGIATDMNKNGNLIAIGAPGDEYPGSPGGMGLVYIFRSGSDGWYNEEIINGSLAKESSDVFGSSVAFNNEGNILFVGSFQDEFINSVTASHGLTYMFRSGSYGWKETAVFRGSRAINNPDSFGISVSSNSNGNIILVGAHQDEELPSEGSSGLAYVFKIT